MARLLPLALIAGLLFTGCTSNQAAAEVKEVGKRKAAPAFTLKDETGKDVTLADYKGKVVLLNFWATWCGPCKVEIPWFVEFEQKYKGQGFAVLGVSMDEDGWKIVKPFLKDKSVNYRVVLGTDQVAELYGGVGSLPTTFVLDRQGRIAATHVGLVSKVNYQNDIEKLLADKRAAAGTGGNAHSAD